MSLVRRFRFGGTTIEGRFEVFNVTNRFNVSGVNSVWGAGRDAAADFHAGDQRVAASPLPGVGTGLVLTR